jgi:hypothetical protein
MNRTHFLYRIDMWTIDGEQAIEYLAGIEDAQLDGNLSGCGRAMARNGHHREAGRGGDRGESADPNGLLSLTTRTAFQVFGQDAELFCQLNQRHFRVDFLCLAREY